MVWGFLSTHISRRSPAHKVSLPCCGTSRSHLYDCPLSMGFDTVDHVHAWATWLMLTTGVSTFLALLTVTAPYGRYSQGGRWGPLINAKLAWMAWESPALIIPALLLLASPGGYGALLAHPLSGRTLLSACFLVHYFYRAIIYPLSTRSGKPAPLSVVFLGGLFCVWNGFLQVRMRTDWQVRWFQVSTCPGSLLNADPCPACCLIPGSWSPLKPPPPPCLRAGSWRTRCPLTAR